MTKSTTKSEPSKTGRLSLFPKNRGLVPLFSLDTLSP